MFGFLHRMAATLKYSRIGQILSLVLYTNNPKLYKFVLSMISVEMGSQGIPVKAFKMLNHLGVCQSLDAGRSHVDKMIDGFDQRLTDIKKNIKVRIFSDLFIYFGKNYFKFYF